ncbi:hypothetical protein BGZ98_000512 [Dissophora globulifera]|nr:hypothetical protein BGZ98_000512 [Dissophora globulifera]
MVCDNGNGQSGSSKSSTERSILPVQRLSATRVTSLSSEKQGNSQAGFSSDTDAVMRRPLTKKQLQQQAQVPKDPLYSLSSASIRARKNALEMENIQRASHLYADYIAKIKALSLPIGSDTNKVTATDLENELSSYSKMDVDMPESSSTSRLSDTELGSTATTSHQDSTSGRQTLKTPGMSSSNAESASLDKDSVAIQGLESVVKSGLLHSLIQQYFILIHPQFMILHKNHFLVRFWADYGPFPEALDIQIQILGHHPPSSIELAKAGQPSTPDDNSKEGRASSPKTSPLLLLAMLALVSRHINDRAPHKSSAADKQLRMEKLLAMIGPEFRPPDETIKYHEKVQEAHLEELMETDEQGQSERGENLQDRGEQYFQWASELLKNEYEQPSLIVVQSLLLLREYAVMAGNHTQAYMYGGTAITMAMGLGWHHAHLRTSQLAESAISGRQTNSSTEEKAEQERQKDNKVMDDEQRQCWWHCFIVDRWMSAAYGRPVNIPVHIFDKTHLRPLPKPKMMSSTEGTRPILSVLTSDFWLASRDDTSTPSTTLESSGVASMTLEEPKAASKAPVSLPGAQFRAKAFFDQQCRQALLLDDILCFLSSWSEDLFVSSAEFEKLSLALDEWHRGLAPWQTFPLSGIISPPASSSRTKGHQSSTGGGDNREHGNVAGMRNTNLEEGRDVVQSTLLGITFYAIRILLYRPFLRTNLRHPPCQPSRASSVCAQSANAMTSLSEYLMNQRDQTLQPCLLMRHQFSLVTAAGIQLMNANLDDEPRLSTPAKINLLKTIRILRDADRSSWGAGVSDGFHQVLRELFPVQMKRMYDGPGSATN